jgi:putative acetyltransferase
MTRQDRRIGHEATACIARAGTTTPGKPMEIQIDDLRSDEIIRLLQDHLEDMYANSPPGSVHALDLDRLRQPEITFWSLWDHGELAGCVALKALDPCHGEIKSMRTARSFRRKGVATMLLQHLLHEAKRCNYRRLSLETGSMAFFEPARALYASFGFEYCGPFSDYQADPHSVFMTKPL